MKKLFKTENEEILFYLKGALAIITICLSILIITDSMATLDYIFDTNDKHIETVEHCVILSVSKDTSSSNDDNRPYIAEVKYDDGEIGYVAIDSYDYMTRRINSDAIAINRSYLQKEKGHI